jgi:hypothetical protein
MSFRFPWQKKVETPLGPDGFTLANGMPAVPIVLGVVGHRDVRREDRETLKLVLVALFKEFKAAYPDTPLVVLSSLAEGADQIAAEAAIDAGAFVRAPLPFAPEFFANSTSFDSSEARDNFWKILGNKARVEYLVVPPPRDRVTDETDWSLVATSKEDGPARSLRHACYANAGGYLTRRCHAMVALWDGPGGSPSQGPSGTEEHVNFKLKGLPPEHFKWRETEPLGFRGERGLVIVVHTPRAKARQNENENEEKPERPVGQIQVLVPNDQDKIMVVPNDQLPLPCRLSKWKRFRALLGLQILQSHHQPVDESAQINAEVFQFRDLGTTIDDFNSDLRHPRVVADVLSERMKDPVGQQVPEFDEAHNFWLLRLTRLRHGAASISSRMEPGLHAAIRSVFILLGLSAFAFHMYAHGFSFPVKAPVAEGKMIVEESLEPLHQPLWLAAAVLLFLASAGAVAVYLWKRLEQRRLDSRALAEALRVRRIWSMSGVGKSVADSYMSQLRGEVSWIRQALLHTCPPPTTWVDQFDRLDEQQQIALLRRVREEWITKPSSGQIPQFETGQKEMHAAAARWRKIGIRLATLSWVALAAILVIGFSPRLRELLKPIGLASDHPGNYFLIATGFLIIVGGLFIAYCERRSYEDLAKQYERMLIVFRYGDRELGERLDASDVTGARRVFEALGREAIVEHSQWLLLRRSRPIEVHF